MFFHNPQFWSSNGAQPEIWQENEIMRMISIFQKISKSGATAVRAQSLTLYAPPRDSIAIPASLMRGDFLQFRLCWRWSVIADSTDSGVWTLLGMVCYCSLANSARVVLTRWVGGFQKRHHLFGDNLP